MSSKRTPAPIGKTFGMLTVIRELPDITSSGYAVRAVLCRCKCGSEKSYRLHNILTLCTVTCGCSTKEYQEIARVEREELYVEGLLTKSKQDKRDTTLLTNIGLIEHGLCTGKLGPTWYSRMDVLTKEFLG